jgi:hypothetical protein
VALAQVVVVEGGGKQLVDQLRGGPAAGAVGHVDAAVFEVERAQVVFLAVMSGFGSLEPVHYIVIATHGQ